MVSSARRARPTPSNGPTMKSDRRAAGRDRRRRLFGDDAGGPARPARHRVLLIEGGGPGGPGHGLFDRASRRICSTCRAEAMSAWADDPEHFARCVRDAGRRGERLRRAAAVRPLSGRDPRRGGGDGHGRGWSSRRQSAAARNGDGWRVELEDGGEVEAAAAGAGAGQPAARAVAVSERRRRFINNPWGAEAHDAIARAAANGGDVLIVGTGLTMVDMVLSLDAAGHRGRIVALSRRGLDPARACRSSSRRRSSWTRFRMGNARTLWRWLRRARREVGWRAAVDALRPHSHAIWQALDAGRAAALPAPRAAVVGRPSPPHRAARSRSADRTTWSREGRLEIVAGRLAEVREDGDDAGRRDRAARRRPRDAPCASLMRSIARGRWHAIGRTRDPLLRQMLDDGLVAAGRAGHRAGGR